MGRDPELEDLERQVGVLVQRYAERKNEVETDLGVQPFVLGWAVVYEFTSTQQEAEHTAGRGVIVPDGQMISASTGLGRYLQQAFDPEFQ